MELREPSGLFPSGPPRPTWREPHPARVAAGVAGAAVAGLWLLLIGLLGTSVAAYVWLSIVASIAAWLTALALARAGDRGVAAGVAVATGVGLAIAMAVTLEQWITVGWPLW